MTDKELRGLDIDRHSDPEYIYDPKNVDPRRANTEEEREIMIQYRRYVGLPDYPERADHAANEGEGEVQP